MEIQNKRTQMIKKKNRENDGKKNKRREMGKKLYLKLWKKRRLEKMNTGERTDQIGDVQGPTPRNAQKLAGVVGLLLSAAVVALRRPLRRKRDDVVLRVRHAFFVFPLSLQTLGAVPFANCQFWSVV